MSQQGIPFNERGGKLRGVLDVVSGRFPRFVFGGALADDLLPVFHFHDESAADLEPKLRYLAESGYRSVTSDEIADFVAGRVRSRDPRVALCFDDAWASVWTVAALLLRRYGLSAIVYAIPGRISEAAACRPVQVPDPLQMNSAGARPVTNGSADCLGPGPLQMDDELSRVRPVTNPPFVTWPELQALQASGLVDVQSHTLTHSRVFTSSTIVDFVRPGYEATPLLNRPQLTPPPALRFVTTDDLGAPIFTARSRMSDGRRVTFDPDVHERCVDLVRREGGAAFFERTGWRSRLEAIVQSAAGRPESEAAQQTEIESELDASRAILNDRLRTSTVRHICLPWGVSGAITERALERLGYRTAFANRLRGVHAVRRGDHPLWLKRLPNRYIFRLPGRGRRAWA